MIKVEKINKKFIKQSKNKKKEEFYADKDISFEAKDNEVLGILGPNGAGKTTLLRMIAGIMTPSGGSITIDNLNYHDNEILNIHEGAGVQIYYQEDKDWHYRSEERRWIPMNDNSGWIKNTLANGKHVKNIFHIR